MSSSNASRTGSCSSEFALSSGEDGPTSSTRIALPSVELVELVGLAGESSLGEAGGSWPWTRRLAGAEGEADEDGGGDGIATPGTEACRMSGDVGEGRATSFALSPVVGMLRLRTRVNYRASRQGFDSAGALIGHRQAAAGYDHAASGLAGYKSHQANLRAGVSCALVCCRFWQVRGLTVSLCRCRSARSLLTARGQPPPKQESIRGFAVSGCRWQTRGSRQTGI